MEKNNVKKKLLQARKFIATTKIKKEGRNAFSKYDYFTPSQITNLVTLACLDAEIVTIFSVIEENEKFKGVLEVYDIDSDKAISFTIPTAMPDIKASNITQKLGGMVTYTQRYLEMIAFGITDNNLDLDSQDNRGDKVEPPIKKKAQKTVETQLPPISDEGFDTYVKWIVEGEIKNGAVVTAEFLKAKHTLHPAQESALLLLKLEQ